MLQFTLVFFYLFIFKYETEIRNMIVRIYFILCYFKSYKTFRCKRFFYELEKQFYLHFLSSKNKYTNKEIRYESLEIPQYLSFYKYIYVIFLKYMYFLLPLNKLFLKFPFFQKKRKYLNMSKVQRPFRCKCKCVRKKSKLFFALFHMKWFIFEKKSFWS